MAWIPLPDLLALAQCLAHDAGTVCRTGFGRGRAVKKPDDSVVTQTDHQVEVQITRGIRDVFPDHAILGEETFDVEPRAVDARTIARYCWVIDPLDGTRNYVAGLPCFATSIAVLEYGRPVAAVVVEHNLQWSFAAAVGQGATLNGEPIRVRSPGESDDVLVGIPSAKDSLTVTAVCGWAAEKGIVLRNFGSTALHLGLVASGALSAALCARCKIWDVAAGVLLVAEAGGTTTDPPGRPVESFDLAADPARDTPVLAGARGTHERLLSSLRCAETEDDP